MLGIILVNYKTINETILYCKEELSKISTPHIIVIVNNSANDKVDNSIAEAMDAEIVLFDLKPKNFNKKVYLISVESNLGYAKGNNLGAKFISENFNDVTHFLFTNNDLILTDSNCVESLLKKMVKTSNIGVIGPRITDINGYDQSPHRYQSIWKSIIFLRFLHPLWAFMIKRGIISKEVIEGAPEGYYYRIMGCFYIVDRYAFNSIAGFDNNTFLYVEEAILSERLAKIGYKTYFIPTISIIHNHGETTKKYLDDEQVLKFSKESLLYYYKEYKKINSFTLALANVSYKFYFGFYAKIYRYLMRR